MIEFITSDELIDKIPAPIPAKDSLPAWYKNCPATFIENDVTNQSIKRCMPFFDMLTTGYLMLLASDTNLEYIDNGREVKYYANEGEKIGFNYIRTIDFHSPKQVEGHPIKRMPCKFLNHWVIKTPPGFSCLFIPPARQDHFIFQCLPAIVDTDKYPAPVNFPFFPTAPDGRYIIKKGVPLVQVIPFKRDTTAMDFNVRTLTEDEDDAYNKSNAKTLGNENTGHYRETVRDKRK